MKKRMALGLFAALLGCQGAPMAATPPANKGLGVTIALKDVLFVGDVNSCFEVRVLIENNADGYSIGVLNGQFNSFVSYPGELVVIDAHSNRLRGDLGSYARHPATRDNWQALPSRAIVGGSPYFDLGGKPIAYPLTMQFLLWDQRGLERYFNPSSPEPSIEEVYKAVNSAHTVCAQSNVIHVTKAKVDALLANHPGKTR